MITYHPLHHRLERLPAKVVIYVASVQELEQRLTSFRTPGFGWGFCCIGTNTTSPITSINY